MLLKILKISILCLILIWGCKEPTKKDDLFKGVKITDLAQKEYNELDIGKLKTINFTIFTYEISSKNLEKAAEIWDLLYTKPIKYNSQESFGANLFSAGIAQFENAEKTAEILYSADGKKINTDYLMITGENAGEFFAARNNQEKPFWYYNAANRLEGLSLTQGILVLKIKAAKNPDIRGTVKVQMYPCYISSRPKTVPIDFPSAGLNAVMSTGDFIVLGPTKYTSGYFTLNGLFFNSPGKKDLVRFYQILCTRSGN